MYLRNSRKSFVAVDSHNLLSVRQCGERDKITDQVSIFMNFFIHFTYLQYRLSLISHRFIALKEFSVHIIGHIVL